MQFTPPIYAQNRQDLVRQLVNGSEEIGANAASG
jgi:hypothetical protein